MASWIAAATAYSTHGVATIPFYIFYSMFGFQRVGDLAWAAGDIRARGFLLGATSGRTTLEGEGLQHDDGHSHVLASVIPSCIAYDPAYAYEKMCIRDSDSGTRVSTVVTVGSRMAAPSMAPVSSDCWICASPW